jgi:WhiB family redox-sensing transcriptional regulator
VTIQRHIETVTASVHGNPLTNALEALQAPAWMRDALCAEVDPELFFPEKGGSTREAKAVCGRCPVAAECLDYALSYEAGEHDTKRSYPSGIYGGLSERERRALRKQLDREAS